MLPVSPTPVEFTTTMVVGAPPSTLTSQSSGGTAALGRGSTTVLQNPKTRDHIFINSGIYIYIYYYYYYYFFFLQFQHM